VQPPAQRHYLPFVRIICKFHRDAIGGPRRDIAITLVSRIWAPLRSLSAPVSKDDGRGPGFVKPLGEGRPIVSAAVRKLISAV
jgi:hypothetical protein